MHESHETTLKEESAQIRPNPPHPPNPRSKKTCPQVLFCETEGKIVSSGYLHIEDKLRCVAGTYTSTNSTLSFSQSRRETQRRMYVAFQVGKLNVKHRNTLKIV